MSICPWFYLYSHSFASSPFCLLLQSQGSGTDLTKGWNTQHSVVLSLVWPFFLCIRHSSMDLVFISSWLWIYICTTVHYLFLSDLENHYSFWPFSGAHKHINLHRHVCCKSCPVKSPLPVARSTYKEEADDDFFRKKPHVHRPCCSQGNFSHHNNFWRDNREGHKWPSAPGGLGSALMTVFYPRW